MKSLIGDYRILVAKKSMRTRQRCAGYFESLAALPELVRAARCEAGIISHLSPVRSLVFGFKSEVWRVYRLSVVLLISSNVHRSTQPERVAQPQPVDE
jgi:hypothetical protein